MLRAFYSSATGMRAQELLIDNTANNIANVNTTGYKRSQLDFADLVYATIRPPGADAGAGQVTPTGIQIGSGVRPVGTTKIFTTGVIQETGNATDLAIEGEGFFKVTMPNGTDRYTRDGSFRMDASGNIVNGDGFLVDAGFQIPRQVPISQISISSTGLVSVGGENGTPLGQLQLYRFQNPAGLSSEGSNLYAETIASGTSSSNTPGTEGMGTLRQGYLEKSNVEVVNELVSLITAQRAYEFNSRAIKAGDEMLSTTAQIVR